MIILVSGLFAVSCSKNDTHETENDLSVVAAKSKNAHVTFKVSIENITGDNDLMSPFAPGFWAVQKKNSAPIFYPGQPDYGNGLEALAEDGNPSIIAGSLENHPKIRTFGVFNTPVDAAAPGPIFPGETYEFTFTAKHNDYLNFATMFVQSNDLFVGPNSQGIALFKNKNTPINGDITGYLSLWDAGTEVNQEPGTGDNQAPRQMGPNQGPDENGVVQLVDDQYTYADVTDMIRVTITPIN